jgi:hypothetical protein
MGSSGVSSSEVLRDLSPRVQMNGAIIMAVLDKFEKADFALDADLKLEPAEVKALARQVGYPLEAVAKAYGIEM